MLSQRMTASGSPSIDDDGPLPSDLPGSVEIGTRRVSRLRVANDSFQRVGSEAGALQMTHFHPKRYKCTGIPHQLTH